LEEDEDDFIEPEMDWDVSSTNIKAKLLNATIDEVKKFIKDNLDEYLK
jgi:hypothetical protein